MSAIASNFSSAGVASSPTESEVMQELEVQLSSSPSKTQNTEDTRMTPTKEDSKQVGSTPCRSLDAQLVQQAEQHGGWQDEEWDACQWGWDDSWWSSSDWGWKQRLPRAWSSFSNGWEKEWGHESSRNWTSNRGYSRYLEPQVHPGWGGAAADEGKHAEAALQRSSTNLLEQSRPTQQAVEKERQDTEAAAKAEQQTNAEQQPAQANAEQQANPEARQQPVQANPEQQANREARQQHAQVKAEQQNAQANPEQEPKEHEAWRKDKRGNYLTPQALYMRFYRSIRSLTLNKIEQYLASAYVICVSVSIYC